LAAQNYTPQTGCVRAGRGAPNLIETSTNTTSNIINGRLLLSGLDTPENKTATRKKISAWQIPFFFSRDLI
jgi:hypothetical protein